MNEDLAMGVALWILNALMAVMAGFMLLLFCGLAYRTFWLGETPTWENRQRINATIETGPIEGK